MEAKWGKRMEGRGWSAACVESTPIIGYPTRAPGRTEHRWTRMGGRKTIFPLIDTKWDEVLRGKFRRALTTEHTESTENWEHERRAKPLEHEGRERNAKGTKKRGGVQVGYSRRRKMGRRAGDPGWAEFGCGGGGPRVVP